ncbi:hypothetical protein H8K32_17630 [Undibacterium jejuense]|uniref:Beta-lactamase n=1 Tax=Undibacterium jejuense TaxID=1344949 RepID=A0A923HQN3_9BURK|nr:hypothetical protein [Undibacterium jejuense]MBC3863931.1 hypothetical protein [Undibacterium jejuense]
MLFITRIFLLNLMAIPMAFAGTKGLDVKLENLGDSDFYQSPIFKQFTNNFGNYHFDECWQHYGDGVSGIHYLNYGFLRLINGHTIQDIFNFNKEAIQNIRKNLHQPDEHTASEGYHGMYIIYPKNGYLTIMGVGANANPKKGLTGISTVIKGIKLDQTKPKEGAKIFERSLCRVSKPFNIGFGV